MLAEVDHPLLHQHLDCLHSTNMSDAHAAYSGTIECSNHLSLANKSQVATADCQLSRLPLNGKKAIISTMIWRGKPLIIYLQSFGTKWIGDAISWARAAERRVPNGGQWQLFADVFSWHLTPRIEYQVWCIWRYLKYKSFSHCPILSFWAAFAAMGLSRKWRVKMPATAKLVHP